MNARKRKANSFRLLASQLKADLEISLQLVNQIKEFAANLSEERRDSNNPNIYAVALCLQHFYTSLETIFKRVVKEFDGEVPTGENWHKLLLDQVTLEIEGVRPALFSSEIKEQLDRLRRFRHVVRHGYEYELDWQQMRPIVDSLSEIVLRLKQDLEQFNVFLLAVAEGIEE